MKWFSNLKIKTKLISSFIVVAIFTAVVGAVGISSMGKINKRSIEMYTNNFKPITNLTKVQKNLQYIRSNFLLMTYEKDGTKLQERIDEIAKWTDEDIKALTDYEKGIITQEEKDMDAELNNNLIPYRQIRSDVIKLLQAGKIAEADAKINEFAKAREKVETVIEKLIELNKKYAVEANNSNEANFKSQTIIMIIIIAVSTGLAVLLGLMIASIIGKPLVNLVGLANRIADGDLNVEVDAKTNDEVGILSKAFGKMSNNINNAMINISAASEQVASGAKQVSDSSMALSQGATEQASTIEELTASVEEISSHTRQNADNANEANGLAEVAKENAIQGNGQMEVMLKAMEEINESSANISKIIKVIDEIAFQTNILALNAAVEAARAGQHGKGFAVVAEEVRNLAARSANAARETTDMIESSIKKVEGGTKIAADTAEALNKIVRDVDKVAMIVNGIAVASNEQAAGIDQISEGIIQVSEVVQANSSTAEESAAASEELSSQAELLRDQVAKFRLKKNNYSFYNGIDELNPELLRVLEDMKGNRKRQNQEFNEEAAVTSTKPKNISLSDDEFGKY
ncbi:methyl-accepting chemotaxis protein [Clostridium thailandense]|uniref:methyl-accepting chemotaxis protein n=1 Tax=Clostridium thailandense TaxID=2794346 RepID=UPI003988F01F